MFSFSRLTPSKGPDQTAERFPLLTELNSAKRNSQSPRRERERERQRGSESTETNFLPFGQDGNDRERKRERKEREGKGREGGEERMLRVGGRMRGRDGGRDKSG